MKRSYLVSACVLALIILITFVSCHSRHKSISGNQAVTVAISPVIKKDMTEETQAVGSVQAFATVSIRARVDGQLLSVGFKEGDPVQTNQVLFSIDPSAYQVQLQSAEANLARDQATLNNTLLMVKRNSPLAVKGYIAQQDFDQMKANAASQEAIVKADMAAVENAKLQLSYCTIRAPINGRTGSLLVNVGNLVKANDATPLLVINQISPINVNFSLPEQQLNAIQKQIVNGRVKVTAIVDKNTQASLEGTLSFIDNAVDTSTGMVQLKATFANDDQKLWPGEFVTVKLPIARLTNALAVPTRAVQAGPRGSYVYVLNKNTAKLQMVQTGAAIGDLTVINSGLKLGETVITEGQMRLTDGTKVQVASSNKMADLNS